MEGHAVWCWRDLGANDPAAPETLLKVFPKLGLPAGYPGAGTSLIDEAIE